LGVVYKRAMVCRRLPRNMDTPISTPPFMISFSAFLNLLTTKGSYIIVAMAYVVSMKE
ncbi:MAG: hypothetical protein GX166_11540, partial [Clostridiaceae bacterium]|nr:hypothetical protein [Clostridiaceae bacterium]